MRKQSRKNVKKLQLFYFNEIYVLSLLEDVRRPLLQFRSGFEVL
jgi:hypothetical protein